MSDFQPVDDPSEAQSLLREGGKSAAAAMIWTKDQSNVINSHITIYSPEEKAIYAWIPKGMEPGQLMDELAKQGLKECFFSVSLARANIFFKAQYLGFDDCGFKFRVPEKIFKVQRRKDMRFSIPDGLVLKVEFQDPLFPDSTLTKKVIDISASGLAFVAAETEEAVFQQGMVLKNVCVAVRGRKITTQGEIRHARKLEGGRHQGIKVGILFKGITPGESSFIASYVFDESRKYFTKFM